MLKKASPRVEETKENKGLERQLSRRSFLKASGTLLAVSASSAVGQEPLEPDVMGTPPPPHVTPGLPIAPSTPVVSHFPGTPNEEVPFAPEHPPSSRVLHFFTPQEARTVEAVAVRIMPGDENDPGAREAGVVTYIDYALSNEHGFNEPIYRLPPYAQGFEGNEPPEEADASFEVIWVPKDELDRYGFQSVLTPREMFRVGLAALDRYANEQFRGAFAKLSEDQQDQVLMDLEGGKAEGFSEPSAPDFFEMIREFTIQGMFADPQYGGNRDLAGWRLLNYPGAQRAYTPVDMVSEGHNFPIQSMVQLDHLHPGQNANQYVILPVFGSEQQHTQPYQPSVGNAQDPLEPPEGEE